MDELADSAVVLGVRCWFKNDDYWEGKWRITENVKYALDEKSYTGGELKILLAKLDFFNKIKLGDKTLAEWGCTACYDNIYWLNVSEPDYTIMIPLSMGKDNMDAASAAGIGANYPITILEGALIPPKKKHFHAS